jgi:hypothetical protein
MTHARGAVSHTIKLPRGQRAEGHDCLELKGREKRRQYVGATAQLLARRSAIAEQPLPFVEGVPGKRRSTAQTRTQPLRATAAPPRQSSPLAQRSRARCDPDLSGRQFPVRAPRHSQSRDRFPETSVLPPNLVVHKIADNCGTRDRRHLPRKRERNFPISVVSIQRRKKIFPCDFQHRDFYPL